MVLMSEVSQAWEKGGDQSGTKRMLWICLPKTMGAGKSEENRIIVAIVVEFKTECSPVSVYII